MPPRWLRLPKTPKTPKPKSGLKLRLNVQRWRRLWRAQRSTTSSSTTTIHFYYVWSVASSGISFAKPRKKENRQTTTSPLKPMAQNKATPDAVQTRREGGERVSTLGDRKNVITANVSMQFDWSCGPLCSPLAWLAFFLVFLSRSNTKLSVILEIVKGIAQAKSPKALNAIPSIPQWREETCQSDDDDDDDGGGSTLEINTKLKSSWK